MLAIMLMFLCSRCGISGNLNGGRCCRSQARPASRRFTTAGTMARILDTIHHSILPALSIILSQIGFWALGMRGNDGDHTGRRLRYVGADARLKTQPRFQPVRNAKRHSSAQLTSLALAMSLIFSGVILVEVIYRYPGMGTLLYNAIAGFDYFVIYGVVFVLIVMVAASTFHTRHRLPIHRSSCAPCRMNRRDGRNSGTNDA